MTIAPMEYLSRMVRRRMIPVLLVRELVRRLCRSLAKLPLVLLTALLLCGGLATYSVSLFAAHAERDSSCSWYTVVPGDTLSRIAWQYHTTISTLASANAIRNVNLIFVSQHVCIPRHLAVQTRETRAPIGGVSTSGTIPWYNYHSLGWSNRSQVRSLLYRAATIHHVPPRLLMAIAWQESGWTQHVIAWDGGIGVMQLMPYTAMGINAGTGLQRDPYDLWDNLNLGATYLGWLWNSFDGNLPDVISAYNEGGWAVRHQGIFNWSYVNNVMALMNDLN